EVAPGLAVRRVVLADRSPLALGQVRPPAPPGHAALARLGQPLPLRVHRPLDHPAKRWLATLARLDRIGTRPPAHQEWSVAFLDKTLTCRDCGRQFVFSSGEQQFYKSRGLTNEPGRCPECRRARKAARGEGGGFGYSGGSDYGGGGGGYGGYGGGG